MTSELALMPQQRSATGMTEVASSRQAQEVQAAVIMARKFPRDTTHSITRIMEDCKRRGLAEVAVYTYPRGGQTVSGPSIRLAETMARAWGNLDCGVTELERKAPMGNFPGESTVMSYAWDLETNTRVTKVFTVKHWRDKKKGAGHGLSDERDIYEMVANQGARRLRACILAIIPKDIADQAVEQCEKTMEGGQGPLIDRVRSIVLSFKDIGVTQEMIEKRLGHKIDVTTEAELVQLKKIGLSIRDNFADRSDFFDIAPEPGADKAPSEPLAQPVSIKNNIPAEQVKTVKQFAPQSAEQAQNWTPGDFTEEPIKVVEKSREEIGREIAVEQKRLKLTGAQVTAFIGDNFGKHPGDMTLSEMALLVDLLKERKS